ncbi:phosphoglycerate mutase-like protein [Aureobasidium subglaciale]|nr:phosphoglycerate mutase-like protein [Aureobasidium subglaciale]
MMLLPVTLAALAVAIYSGLQQELSWLDPIRNNLDAIMSNWTSPITSIANITNFTNVTAKGDWNIFYHLGGNSPWIPKLDGVVEGGFSPPEGCRVEQVHMMPHLRPRSNRKAGMVSLHNHLRTLDFDLEGDLAFFKNWTYFMPDTNDIGQLIPTGPYAGTLGAFQAGVDLRTRYPDLRATAIAQNQTNFWAAGSRRVIETAKLFAGGFWGVDWEHELAKMHTIPESSNRGADTLTTGSTCKAARKPENHHGLPEGPHASREWMKIFVPAIIQRLGQQNPRLKLTSHDIHAMQSFCGFDLLARGSSPWCDVFNPDEWRKLEYARDLSHYYRHGPGNKYSAALGFPFLNATTNLLSAGTKNGSLFLSFAHDNNILSLLTALDLFPILEELPTDHVPEDRSWRTSTLIPMGGRVIFERMVYCHSNAPLYPNHIYCDPPLDEPYVRIVINDGVVAIPGCDDGPGRSCPLASFERRVMLRGWEVGDFGRLCELEEGSPSKISFLHQ